MRIASQLIGSFQAGTVSVLTIFSLIANAFLSADHSIALLGKALNNGNDTGNVNIPVVVCASKVDLESDREGEGEQLTFHTSKGLPYYDISVRSPYNLEEPLLRLARTLLRNPALV
jgi:hypothetical protein